MLDEIERHNGRIRILREYSRNPRFDEHSRLRWMHEADAIERALNAATFGRRDTYAQLKGASASPHARVENNARERIKLFILRLTGRTL